MEKTNTASSRWKDNWEESSQRYLNWWNQKGVLINMWEHLQQGVTPHADVAPPVPHGNVAAPPRGPHGNLEAAPCRYSSSRISRIWHAALATDVPGPKIAATPALYKKS